MVPATTSDMDSGADSTDATIADATPARVSVPKPQASGCVTDVSPGKRQVDCDGLTHDVTVPEACIDTQCGLILEVHGGTMNAKMEDNNTNLSMLGSAHGYVVVQPNAANGLFDATTDDAKVLAFAQTMISVFHLDPKRAHDRLLTRRLRLQRFICQHTDSWHRPRRSTQASQHRAETDCSFTGRMPRAARHLVYTASQGTSRGFQNGVTKQAVIAAFSLGAGQPVGGDNTYRHTLHQCQGHDLRLHRPDHISIQASRPTARHRHPSHCYPGSKT
jgi:hypothetical protein